MTDPTPADYEAARRVGLLGRRPRPGENANHLPVTTTFEAIARAIAQARADERERRWVLLRRTSPSGKVLYLCRSCERITPAPSYDCEGEDCEEWEAAIRRRGEG